MLKPKADSNDKMLKDLREISSSGGNKQCFDCGQKGVTAIDMTIGSFVCTTCSGIL
jgi:Arf-GAP domain and FG repeats-containing protein 1